MSKKYFVIIAGLVLFLGAGCMFKKDRITPVIQETDTAPKKVDIAVSIYPLAYFTEKVGGDLVQVHLITPGGIEPHDYEPTPLDIIVVESSKALVYNGGGIDAWADRVAPELNKKGIQVLKMENHLGTSGDDPHFWLDPVLAQKQVENIVQLLNGLDPDHRDIYENNAALYLGELSTLGQEYKTGFLQCDLKEIISSHDAFNYLGRRYGITVHAIAGISPEDEPSASRLAELTRLVQQKKIKTIFFESLITPKLSETLAQETGATSAVLNPIEGLTEEEAAQGKNYDILMRDNLQALKKAMVCH